MSPTIKASGSETTTRRVSGGWLLSLLLVVSLVLGLLAYVPTAYGTHLTWAATDIYNPSDALAESLLSTVSITSFGTRRWVAFQDQETDDFVVGRNIDNGGYVFSVVATTGSTGQQNDIHAIANSNLIACTVEAGDVFFASSNDGGVLWTVAEVVTANTVDECSVAAFSPTTYVIVYPDETATDMFSIKSTDSGATWGSPVTVSTSQAISSDSIPKHETRVRSEGGTNAVVVFHVITTNALESCRTTDTAATWTCATIGAQTTTAGLSLEHTIGSTYALGFGVVASGSIQFCKTTNTGTTWACGSAGTLTGLTNVGVATLGDALSYAAFATRDIGASDDTPAWYTDTTDGGGSWGTLESVATISPALAAGGTAQGAAIRLVGSRIVTVFEWDADTTTSTDDHTLTESVALLPGELVGASSTASVTDLVGFDVDRTGSVVIARTDGGDMVRTFGATNLATELDNFDTQCSRDDGIMAAQAHVGYLNCDVGGEVQELHIRNPSNLAQATFENCGNTSVCPMTVDLDEAGLCDGFTDRTVFGEVQEISFAPLNWSRVTDEETLSADDHAIAFSYATSTGFIGVAQFTANDDQSCDEYATERKSYTGGVVDQICTWESSGDEFIVAADQEAAVNVYTYVPAITAGKLDGSMSDPSVYSSLFGSLAVDCAQDNFLVATGTGGTQTIRLFNAQTSSVIWTITGIDNALRGVALSNDGLWCAYVSSSTEAVVCDASDGSTLCTLTLPGGTFRAIQLSARGQNAWVASSTTINQYSAFACTTGDPVSDTDPGLPSVTPTPSASGLFGGAGSSVGAAIGVGSFGGNLFLGALLMGFVSFGVGTGGGALLQGERSGFRWSWGAAAVGAAIGFLLAWGFGFFSTAVVFSMVVLIGMTVAIRLWVNRG